MRWTFDDDTRWTAAWAVLRRSPTEEARRIRTAEQWRTAGISIAAGVAVVVALGATGLHGLVLGARGEDLQGGWRTALSIAGYGLAVAGLVLSIPRRYGLDRVAGLPGRAPAEVLSRSQRQQLDRQITGADPLDPDLLPLAFDRAARRINEPLPVLRASVGGVLLGSVALRGTAGAVLALWVLTLVALAFVVPQQLAARSAALAFVDRHGPDVR
ncbi:hypothetical protein [Nakamurella deserti]|uniref:hypothetical protein n=1 Tax=Nakamurella deserti TaxID=2164074 RepID=UPI000DBE5A4E|nr:hypothetical protein [Nakamurella deserti]